MRWSFRVARISGIDIRVHATFFLILLLGAYQWGTPHGVPGAVFGAVLMLLLFTCVTLHELGHSLVAQAFKIPVREIVLLPLGGVAMLGKNPDKPSQELLIALAGPAVNVVIAGLLFLGVGGAVGLGLLDPHGLVPGMAQQPGLESMLAWLLLANISLVLFNMIPAFPLDGGRVLRALLAMAVPFAKATRWAAALGQLIAVALGTFGVLSGNFLLALVAAFIFFGAGAETAHAESKTVLQTLRVGDAYNRHALVLHPADRLGRVVDYILTSYQPDFAVKMGRNLLGVVTREDALNALDGAADDPPVTGLMRREVLRVESGMTLHEVQEAMVREGQRVAAVYSGDAFLGLVSIEDIAEAFVVVRHLEARRERPRLSTA